MENHLVASSTSYIVFARGSSLPKVGEEVGDVIPRMTVETSAQTLLVEEMGNKTNASAENEETVEDTHLEVVLGLLSREGTAVADEIDEADSNAAVDVEDQVVLLGGGDSLDGESVVEELVAGEVVEDVLLDQLDTEIGVVSGLDTVTDTGDELVSLAHAVDEVTRAQALVESACELLSGTVESTTESRTNGQETRDKSTDQVLTSTSGDDGVHGTRHSRTVVGGEHENHLEELGGVGRKAAAEPKQRHDTTDTNILLENVGNGHAGVEELLTTVIGDGRNESSGLSDETKLLGPGVVKRDLRNDGLGLGNDGAVGDELVVNLFEGGGEVLESGGDVEASLLHLLVLHLGSLELRVGERTSVTELNLGLEHAGAGTNGPGDDGLGDDALLNGLNNLVLLNTTNLTKQDKDLALGVGLVAQKMVDEGGTGVAITTDSNTLVHTVGVLGDNVVELVGHTTRLGDVANGTLAVKLGGNNVVHHTTGVTNLEAARLDTTDGSGTDDGNALLLSDMGDLTSSLGNHRSEVDDNVNVGVLLHSLVNLLVDGQQSLAGSPVHLADELTAESVDNTGNGGLGSLANEVEIEHALDGSGLKTVDEASRLVGEESVLRKRAQRSAGSRETLDVVVSRQAVGGSGSHCKYRSRRCE
ncbi:hypothetical protein HG530_008854 [Fusarium avenaceum]|nr:hypothetical protein HG530_008854 [Fusarium avenaceum]